MIYLGAIWVTLMHYYTKCPLCAATQHKHKAVIATLHKLMDAAEKREKVGIDHFTEKLKLNE